MLTIPKMRRIRPADEQAAPRRAAPRWRLMLLVVVAILLAAVPAVLNGWGKLHDRWLEHDAPVISLHGVPPGIGLEPHDLTFLVKDDGAGLDEVIVRITQKDGTKQLLRESFPGQQVASKRFTVRLPGKEAGYRRGDVQLEITAFDRSLWNNSGTKRISLGVDYTRPRIEPVSIMHNVELGGVEFAFYRLQGKVPPQHGVMWEHSTFPGYPASAIDPEFSTYPDVFFSFFAVPLGFDGARDRLRLFARDEVGNAATANFKYLLQPRKYGKRKVSVKPEFISGPVLQLAKDFRASVNSTEPLPDDAAGLFRIVNEEYRRATEKALAEILEKSEPRRLWQSKFIRPVGGREVASFGDELSYELQGQAIASALSTGVDLAAGRAAPVLASNTGTAVFAGPLGVLGNTVVLDHGFGLATVYAHLSELMVARGDSVPASAVLGKTGATGFIDGEALHFEIRQAGVPVRAAEWWDDHWLTGHVDHKILAVKRTLGIYVPKNKEAGAEKQPRKSRAAATPEEAQ